MGGSITHSTCLLPPVYRGLESMFSQDRWYNINRECSIPRSIPIKSMISSELLSAQGEGDRVKTLSSA